MAGVVTPVAGGAAGPFGPSGPRPPPGRCCSNCGFFAPASFSEIISWRPVHATVLLLSSIFDLGAVAGLTSFLTRRQLPYWPMMPLLINRFSELSGWGCSSGNLHVIHSLCQMPLALFATCMYGSLNFCHGDCLVVALSTLLFVFEAVIFIVNYSIAAHFRRHHLNVLAGMHGLPGAPALHVMGLPHGMVNPVGDNAHHHTVFVPPPLLVAVDRSVNSGRLLDGAGCDVPQPGPSSTDQGDAGTGGIAGGRTIAWPPGGLGAAGAPGSGAQWTVILEPDGSKTSVVDLRPARESKDL